MKEMMEEIIQEKKKVFQKFLREYGKLTIVFVVIFLILVSLLLLVRGTTPSSLRVSFLDIGQGDAIPVA